jgi:hypothetical protein
MNWKCDLAIPLHADPFTYNNIQIKVECFKKQAKTAAWANIFVKSKPPAELLFTCSFEKSLMKTRSGYARVIKI